MPSSFVAGFKSEVVSAVDDYIDERHLNILKYNRYHKFWQSNYHDHIIRHWGEYHRIAQYIIKNPPKWDQNKYQKRISLRSELNDKERL